MREKGIMKMMMVVDVLLLSCVILVFVYFGRSRKAMNGDVLGVQQLKGDIVIDEDTSVPICHEDSCVWLSTDGLLIEGIVDRNAVYQKVLNQVIPYFEEEYGGKTAAQSKIGSFIYWKEDMRPDLSNIYDDVYSAFISPQQDYVEVEVKDLPGTDGRYVSKYIEIDNSKQKMYVWFGGQVQKEISISGPKEGNEVYGVFLIANKQEIQRASTGEYMPYWISFHYSPGNNDRYALHGLTWTFDENSQKVYQPVGSIGVRGTDGSITTVEKDAEYIYDLFEKGDPILIHE